jgi:quinol monooxygenase YgiN
MAARIFRPRAGGVNQPRGDGRAVRSAFRGTLGSRMFIVLVDVQVKPESVAAFRQETVINAQKSLEEPGVARFDLLLRQDDPTQFVLVEVYRDADASAQHKQTAHYAAWRDAVEPMMAAPRRSTKFDGVFPSASGWDAKERGAE